MKQYKTLKDIPGVKAGTIGIRKGESSTYFFANTDKDGTENVILFDEYDIKRFPDFFEEVKELEKLFDIQDMYEFVKDLHGCSINTVDHFFKLLIVDKYPQHIDQLKYIK